MPNIQEEITGQVFELMLRFLGTGSEFTYQISHEGNVLLKEGSRFSQKFLETLINRQKENGEPTGITAQMLLREQQGEKIHTMLVPDEEAAELSQLLEKHNVLFNPIEVPDDDSKVYMYMSGDTEKVADVMMLLQAERGIVSEINPSLFLENYAQEEVGTISGLDRTDLELFRGYAKQNGLVFSSVVLDGPGKYLVLYDPKDREEVQRSMGSTLWALSGKEGRQLRERYALFLKNKQEVKQALNDSTKELYIVDGKSPENYIRLSPKEFAYCKNFKTISSVSRNNPEFLARGLRVLDGLEQPILLTREEFERYKEDGEPDKEAIQKTVAEKTKAMPDQNKLREAQDKQNERLRLIQSKLALDDENTAGFWIYDNSVTFSDGGSYENTEDIDEQTKEDLADARNNSLQYKFHEVHAVDTRSLDYFITEAEKERKETSDERQQQEQYR